MKPIEIAKKLYCIYTDLNNANSLDTINQIRFLDLIREVRAINIPPKVRELMDKASGDILFLGKYYEDEGFDLFNKFDSNKKPYAMMFNFKTGDWTSTARNKPIEDPDEQFFFSLIQNGEWGALPASKIPI